MAGYYIEIDDDLYYKFNASAAAYPTAIAAELGVTSTRPAAPAKVTRAGTFADHGIVRVRLPIVDNTGNLLSTRYRLCDIDNFSDAADNLPGVAAFGGVIDGVYPVRKRILL